METPIRLLKTINDQNADGIADSITTTVYGSDGRLLSESSDFDADGSADAVTTYTYDERGNRTGQFFDRGLDGRFEYVLNSSFVFDEAGNLTITYTDGEVNAFQNTYVYDFDTNGNFLKETINGRVTQEYTYNDAGSLILFEDRAKNTATVFEYDDDNRIISSALYDDASGTPASIETYEYDDSDNFIKQERVVRETGFRSVTTYSYDSAGNLIESFSDPNVDGIVSDSFPQFSRITQRRTYEYDDSGNAISETLTQRNLSGGGGNLTFVYIYDYDEAGNFVKGTFDAGDGGQPETIEFYEYDEAGRLTYQAVDNRGDGNPNRITTYEFSDTVPNVAATDDTLSGKSDLIIIGNVFADNGSGLDSSPIGSKLQVSQINGQANSLGTQVTLASGAIAEISPNGQLLYNPNGQFDNLAPGSSVTDSFTYTVTDGGGTTDTATVNVTINGVIKPPIRESVLRQTFTYDNATGDITNLETSAYDDAGNLLRTMFYNADNRNPNTIFTYNAAGDIVLDERDNNTDGTIDEITTYLYDDRGNPVTQRFDTDGDGIADFSNAFVTYTYDENDNILSRSSDFGNDGTIESIERFTYDANGNVLEESRDFDADGEPDSVTTNTYDENGNLLSESTDPNGQTVTYTYDESDNLLSESRDRDRDGSPDSILSYSYDASGNLLEERVDFNGDGITDNRFISTYDDAGNLSSSAADYDNNGVLSDVFRSTYDAAGNRIRSSFDSNGDGTPESITTYTFDAAGNEIRKARDFDADGMVDSTTVNVYTLPDEAIARRALQSDDLSNSTLITTSTVLFTQTIDFPADGTPDTIRETLYGADDNILSQSFDSDANGVAEDITTYTYNSSGDVASIFRDFDGDRSIDYTINYDYDFADNGNSTITSIGRFTDASSDDYFYSYTLNPNGNIISQTFGSPDNIPTTYTYNDAGQLTVFDDDTIEVYEYNAAGQVAKMSKFAEGSSDEPISVETYTYNDAGNLVSFEIDYLDNLSEDRLSTYIYDEDSNLIEFNSIKGDDPAVRYTYGYDDAGRIVQQTRPIFGAVSDGIGVVAEYDYTFEYDEFGNFIRETIDENDDGQPDEITSYGYDTSGRLILEERDFDADGIADYVTTYDFAVGTSDGSALVGSTLVNSAVNSAIAGDSLGNLSTPSAADAALLPVDPLAII